MNDFIYLPKDVHQKFTDRINFILRKRKLYPWAQAMGLSKGAAEKIKKGIIPGGNILDTICRHENLSLSWLVSNIGRPYAVNHFYTEAAFAEYIKHQDNNSEFLISRFKEYLILVTVRSNSHSYRDNVTSFKDFRVAVGPISQLALKALQRGYKNWSRTKRPATGNWCTFQLSADGLELMLHGCLSPHELFESNLKNCLLTKIKSTAEISQFLNEQTIKERTVISSMQLNGKILEPTSS